MVRHLACLILHRPNSNPTTNRRHVVPPCLPPGSLTCGALAGRLCEPTISRWPCPLVLSGLYFYYYFGGQFNIKYTKIYNQKNQTLGNPAAGAELILIGLSQKKKFPKRVQKSLSQPSIMNTPLVACNGRVVDDRIWI